MKPGDQPGRKTGDKLGGWEEGDRSRWKKAIREVKKDDESRQRDLDAEIG